MELFIRRYLSKDFEKVLNLDGRPSPRREQKLRLVEHGAYYCYVAEDGADIVGFVIMEDLGDDDAKSHYMVQINVAQKRRGIGKGLVLRVFGEIGFGGHVSLCVNTDNYPAIGFYESLGFRKSGFTAGYRKNQDKLWYQIDLS